MSAKTIIAVSALAALASSAAAQSAAQINTPPSLTECQPVQLAFSGTAPFFVKVIPGGQPSGAPLEQFPEAQTSPITWTVDIASGTSITLALTDGTGATAFSDAVTVSKGLSTSCIKGAAGSSNSTAGSDSSSAASSKTTGETKGHTTSASGPKASSTGTTTSNAPPAANNNNNNAGSKPSGASSAGGPAQSAGPTDQDNDSGASSLLARSAVAVLAVFGAAALLA